ncbi:hypothetical protein diail_5285 [Diaporthe ilicicola]|nr:hypothetical protein diail_5285 [Diaporthe ilicicola]
MQAMSVPAHDAGEACAPLTMMNYDLNEPQLVMDEYLDDFTSFMDNMPIPNSVFSPSYQPIPTFLPATSDSLSFGNDADPFSDIELPFPARLQQHHDSAGSSALSAYGSRLPSLQPEESPAPASEVKPRHPQHEPDLRDPSRGNHAHLTVSMEDRERAMEELVSFSSCLPSDVVLPSKHALSRYVSAYVTVFNEHYPFLHVPTLQLGTMRVELFLAIAAMGARYSREPGASTELFELAKSVGQERLKRRYEPGAATDGGIDNTTSGGHTNDALCDSRSAELETVQALVLLMAISMWFKRQPDVYETIHVRSMLDTLIREDIVHCERGTRPYTWAEWIQYETFKRTRLVIFCFFNIQTIVSDAPPLMLADQLRQDLPCTENEWKATSEQDWLASHDDCTTQEDFKVVLERLFELPDSGQYGGPSVTARFSSLGGCVLIHAIIQRIWLVRHSGFHGGLTNQQLSPEMMNTFERALKCWSSCWESGRESSMDPLSPHGPLSFTSTALLRIAYIRINMDTGPIRSLGSWDAKTVARSLDSGPPAQRSHRLTRAALHCAHALSIPIKLGINYVAQTQVVYWSNQHALCSLECAVLLAKWLEAVTGPEPSPPLNSAENRTLHFVVQLVAEANHKGQTDQVLQERGSLASTVVRLWASLYKAESVWEMVDLMARSLLAFADFLELRSRALQAATQT